jgi:Domain of unknown function (DUF1998)
MSTPKRKRKIPPAGQLRRSQVITTFGPGAMIDLPEHSVIVGGLESWTEDGRHEIHEERLATRIRELLGLEPTRELALYSPPIEVEDPRVPRTGITCFTFPAWFVAQDEREWKDPATGKKYRSRPLVHWLKLVRGKFLNDEREHKSVVPLRFVQACPNGHISDIDWYRFVHEGKAPVKAQLWLDEGGTGADLTEIFVRCEATKARRSLGVAKADESRVLGQCNGERPWLRDTEPGGCKSLRNPKEPEWNRLLVRSASHAYFTQVPKAISLPEADQLVREAVDQQWEDELRFVEDLAELRKLRKKGKPKVEAALGDLEDESVWAEIARRLAPADPEAERKTIKQAEIETLMSDRYDGREDAERKFLARKREISGLAPGFTERIERVVLVERLRQVQVQIGFTRFDSPSFDIDDSLTLPVKPAPLSAELEWLPAVELLGEGIFLGFHAAAIDAWMDREAVKLRGKKLRQGFDAWHKRRGLPDTVRFAGLPYIMLHTLSHLLINAVALECGYSASAIGERIYAGRSGYGILLYTGTPGSEGTLGGLVEVGKRIEDHLAAALESAQLCSNDPLCAQHEPHDAHEERFLHGAACHGCVLIGEPSCERRNELLDRALVIPTVEGLGAEFFPREVLP